MLDWLSLKEHEQGAAFVTPEPADLLPDFRATGCWLQVGEPYRPGPAKFLQVARFAARQVAAFRPDVVVAWPMGMSHWIFLGARLAGSSAALLSHAGNPPGASFFGRYISTWLCVWLTGLCRGRVVACSRYVQQLYQAIPLVPRALIGFAYNSVRVDEIARRAAAARTERRPGDPLRVIMVATLEAHKDHATLIRAAALLREQRVPVVINVVGAGRLEGELKALAASLNVTGTVHFLGARRDVPELLGQSDLFVFSTTMQEGFGIVLIEALSAGLPIVATDVPPLREVLEDGRWGTLVLPGDPGALAVAIRRIATTEPSGIWESKARGRFAAEFAPARMVDRYVGIATVDLGGSEARV